MKQNVFFFSKNYFVQYIFTFLNRVCVRYNKLVYLLHFSVVFTYKGTYYDNVNISLKITFPKKVAVKPIIWGTLPWQRTSFRFVRICFQFWEEMLFFLFVCVKILCSHLKILSFCPVDPTTLQDLIPLGGAWFEPVRDGQGWEIARFKNVRSLFLKRKKVQFGNLHFFAHFHTFALFKRTILWSLFLSHFWKEQQKSVIAQSLFWKERQKVRSHNCTFEKSKNVRCANVRLPNPAAGELFLHCSTVLYVWQWMILCSKIFLYFC